MTQTWDEMKYSKTHKKSKLAGKIMNCRDIYGLKARGKIIDVYRNTYSWECLADGSRHIGLKTSIGLQQDGQSWQIVHDKMTKHFDAERVQKMGHPANPAEVNSPYGEFGGMC